MNKDVLQAKSEKVEEIVSKAQSNKALVVVTYHGLTVDQITELRRSLKKENASLSVYKNTLVERAADKLGYEELKEILTGPNAIVFGEKVDSGLKLITKYARRNEDFVIKGAVFEGQFVGPEQVKELSKVGGREGLLSMFLSVLQAPVRQFACAVKAVADAK